MLVNNKNRNVREVADYNLESPPPAEAELEAACRCSGLFWATRLKSKGRKGEETGSKTS